MGSSRWDRAALEQLISDSDSYASVLRGLGLAIHAGNYKTLHSKIDGWNLDTSHFVGRAWVGHRKTIPREAQPLEEILIEGGTYSTAHLRVRLLRENVFEHRCQGCGLEEWRGQPIPLELDHINGVSNDHRVENLRLLCPNCHALTPTWKGRNAKHPASTCACGQPKTKTATSCKRCAYAKPRPTKADWPATDRLRQMVRETNMSAVGRSLGVSCNAVKKRLGK